jgi:hypothetical protein
MDGFADIPVDEHQSLLTNRFGDVRSADQLAQILANGRQFLAEALKVDERAAQIVGDAIDEHFVFAVLLR